MELKYREQRVRRAAKRRGWTLEKSRSRDPHALGYGLYYVADAKGIPVHSLHLPDLPYSATLEQVEELLGVTHTER